AQVARAEGAQATAAAPARRWRDQAMALGTAMAMLALWTAPVLAYRDNRALLVETRDVLQRVAGERAQNASKLVTPASLSTLRAHLAHLRAEAARAPALATEVGLAQAQRLAVRVEAYYRKLLQDELIAPIVRHDAQTLRSFGQRYQLLPGPPAGPEYKELFDRLEAYLLLTHGEALGADPTGSRHAWLLDHLRRRWSLALGGTASEQSEAMTPHLEAYLAGADADPNRLEPRDSALVTAAQAVLARMPADEALLEHVVGDAEAESLSLRQLVAMGDGMLPWASEARVRGGYTRRGYETVVAARLAAWPVGLEAWVLGDPGGAALVEAARRTSADAIGARYWRRYAAQWRAFLLSVRAVAPRDALEALALVQSLSLTDPPTYRRFLQAVADNTRVAPPLESVAALPGRSPAPQDASADEPAAEDVLALPLDLYQQQLGLLRLALEAYIKSTQADEAVRAQLQAAHGTVQALWQGLRGEADRQLVQNVLGGPLEVISEALVTWDEAQAG
ncbi:MAG TPA: ImcF-related family protein, partial [Myxococcota bacterium]|nr:ImcF-related family protein [Myxococcota bacterium]